MTRATSDARPPRPQGQDDTARQAERFRAAARHIVTQLDIEAAMWQMLDKGPNDAPAPGNEPVFG